jgi:alpha-glucoside transport system permease protein
MRAARVARGSASPIGMAGAVAVALVWTLPLIGLAVTALRPPQQAVERGWWSVVTDPSLTLENLRSVLGGAGPVSGLWGALWSSMAIAVPATALTVVVALAAAYGLAWTRGRAQVIGHLTVVALLFVPLQAVLIPLVTVYDRTGLQGTLPGLWMAHLAFGLPLAVLLLSGAMRLVPSDLVDAARTDGAGHLDVLGKVVLPLALPAVAGVAALQFLLVWNDFLVAATLLGDPRASGAPLPLALADLVRTWPQELHLHAAGVVVTAAVPLVVFLGLHRLLTGSLVAATVRD